MTKNGLIPAIETTFAEERGSGAAVAELDSRRGT